MVRKFVLRTGLLGLFIALIGSLLIAPAQAATPQECKLPAVTLKVGVRGSAVKQLQTCLSRLGYLPGKADGWFGAGTYQAVMSFQKANSLGRDAIVGPASRRALAATQPVNGMPAECRASDKACISLAKQVMYLKTSGGIKIIGISSGNNQTYKTKSGGTARAFTPKGRFTIQRKILGERVSDFGVLYDPSYFYRGWAIHGSPSVPAYPASHGCIRVPRYIERMVSNNLPVGSPVTIF